MDNKYLNLSKEMQTYVEYAISDGIIHEGDLKLLRRKALDYGDDPDEVEMVVKKLLFHKKSDLSVQKVNTAHSQEIESQEIEIKPSYNLIQSYASAIKKYKDFKGRASRSEFWYFILFNYTLILIISILISSFSEEMDKSTGLTTLVGLFLIFFYLFTITPFISLWVRRIHDTNKSGRYIFYPGYNIISLFVSGTKGENKYGQDPYALVTKKIEYAGKVKQKSIKSSTLETIGGTLIASSATIHKMIDFKWITYDQLGDLNRFIWLIGTLLLVSPKIYKFISDLNKRAFSHAGVETP